jgi:hypothetical protein
MNELHNKTVERNGKIYHYDPDQDIYYARYAPMSTFDRYAWIILIVILGAVAWYLEWNPLR